MEYSIEIGKIIEGALKLDNAKVKSYSKLLINKLNENEDYIAAKKLARILEMNEGSELLSMGISDVMKMPVDPESRVPIADVIQCPGEEELVLLQESMEEMDMFVLTYQNAQKLSNMGIEVTNRLLMYGPPGCGKTKSAYYIANKLKLPLVIARIDSIISSYLGNTAKNIRTLFDYVERVPCVLFLDEFDAIAKARDDSNELGELKRVVNSLLQNIDNLSSESVLIAATNHHEILDNAIWRRFNYKIQMGLPDFESRKSLIKMIVDETVISEKDIDILSIAMNGLSGADIHQLLRKAITKAVIYNRDIGIELIFEELFLANQIIKGEQEAKERLKEKAKYLRALDEKTFSYTVIANILGISKTQVSNLLKN